MTGIWRLACLWLITQTGTAVNEIQFFKRQEGESVVLPCAVKPSFPPPFAVYLRRKWLIEVDVLYKDTEFKLTVENSDDENRISVSGDPSSHSVNVTISDLRATDTDRYYCEFVVESLSSADKREPGTTEFFLLVTPDAHGPADIGLVETCAGGSAVLPCFSLNAEGLAVEGVSLKRQRGSGPLEMLYHSKSQHGSSPPSSSSSSQFATERVHLSSAPGPGGINYNLTLRRLQPEDSAMYSCQLLLHGRSDISSSLGRRVFFVSVGHVAAGHDHKVTSTTLHLSRRGDCGCSSYSTLLYALSGAVAVLLVLLFIGFVVIYKGKARHSVKSPAPAPIYEEMAGVKPLNRKLPPCHLEEIDSSEYRNCPPKKTSTENHYESPSGALFSRT